MGALMRATDWARTPVGAPESWPQSLRTAIGILLASGYPMYVAWGREFIQFYNDAYRPILGATKHPSALGRSTTETFAEIWHIIGPMFERVMDEGAETSVVDFLLPMNRFGYVEECYFTYSYSAIPDGGGGTGGVLVTVVETTERVLAERRMRTLRDLGSAAVEAKTIGDAEARCMDALAANRHDLPFALLYRIEGRHATSAGSVNLAPDTLVAPASFELDADDAPWPLDRVVAGETVEIDDLRAILGSDPTSLWDEPATKAMILPITGRSHPAVGAALMVGLNPRRALDDDYREFLQHVAAGVTAAFANARALEAERARAETLAELDRAKTAFFSNVSHEFRTPLTLMLGPVEDLLAGNGDPLTPSQRDALEVTHRNALRLLKLVNSLLDFSRIEAGRTEASYEATDLAEFTADLASTFRSAIERAGLRFIVDTPPLPQPVYVDREMWEKIVLNFLSNAFKFTLDGEIAVTLRAVDDAVELEVRDTGVGIPADEIELVFQRFHRVKGARGRTHEGTGIGLALVQELVKLHGGTVRASSTPGRGSAFVARIPTGQEHLPGHRIGAGRTHASTATGAIPYVEEALRWVPREDGAPPAEVPGGSPPVRTTGAKAAIIGARVLLADDNADMRDYVARLLRQHGYEVETVPDGAAALAAIARRRPDLVLSDVMMPVLDGFELVAALRRDTTTRDIPIVLLSARAGEEARIEGVEAGADDYLVKPFSARELLARIGAHIEMARVRTRAEVALRESEERARLAVETARMGTWNYEMVARIVHFDERMREIWGRSVGPAIPLDDAMLHIHPDDRDVVAQRIAAALEPASDGSYSVDYRVMQPDGTERWLFVNGRTHFTGTGADRTPVSFFGTALDITARKQAEEERERLLQREQAALREAEEARREAEAASRAKSDFLAVMSHELRTPLNAIFGYTELLRMDVPVPIPDEARHHIERVQLSAQHLLHLIEEVLTFSRLDAGREQMRPERIDFGVLVREACQLVEPLALQKGLEFRCVAPDDVVVEMDAGKLRQILLNLLGNAIKFTDQGSVDVTASATDSDVTLRVRDTGPGIRIEYHETIFEPFRQVEGGHTRRAGGTGLGLSVTRNLARLLGGDVALESTPGTGSTFTVVLPRRIGGITAERQSMASAD